MTFPWSVGVVIPARDEELNITECLEAVMDSLCACPEVRHFWITLVADSCTDRTADIARTILQRQGEVIECSVASAGAARRLGAQSTLNRLLGARGAAAHSTWLANTDADSVPTRDWLRQQLDLANRGYSAVAGIVRLNDSEHPEVIRSHLDNYVLHSDGTHPHVHGANLGLRADAYLDVGGWSDLALAEDHCLWNRLSAREWKTVASIASTVTTSARLRGRAPGGFADRLRSRVLGYGNAILGS